MDIVFATHNAHKRAEVEAIMRLVWPEVHLIPPSNDAPNEDRDSFVGNALVKAREAFRQSGIPSIADDSGICVDALGGRPGIDSAHYSGTRDDANNVQALLGDMAGHDNREAHFVCAVAYVDAEGEVTLERHWPGSLAHRPSGAGGFGYDPIFIPHGFECTAAELTAEDKNRISHRGQAFAALATALAERYAD